MPAKKTTAKKTAADPKPEPPHGTILVEVINQPIYEADAYREKGSRFELPAARAEALRNFVKPVASTTDH